MEILDQILITFKGMPLFLQAVLMQKEEVPMAQQYHLELLIRLEVE